MGKVIIYISMSLDGFINDKNGSVDKLYPDFEEMHNTQVLKDEIQNTGAVMMGKHAFGMAEKPDWYAGNYEFQTPIFVLTHTVPAKHPKETEHLRFTFVTSGAYDAINQAKKVAGNKDVQIIGGASTIQQCLNTGLCDELRIAIIPVLLGEGLSLFDHIDISKVKLEKIKSIDSTSQRTDLLYKILK